jgi:hypothetical protein
VRGSEVRRLLGAVALACATAGAAAHDTWLVPLPDTERGERALALSTGEHYPTAQTGLAVEQLAALACIARAGPATGTAWPLRWSADRPEALWLRSTRAVPREALLDCRVQSRPQAIELAAAQVPAWLDEARAGSAARQHAQQLQAQGRPWRERFSKHARHLGGGAVQTAPFEAGAVPGEAAPPLELDLRLQLPRWPLQRGDRLRAQVLLQGQPLADQAVELRSDLSPVGLWFKSDAEGWIEVPLPLAARWMLRSIALQPGAGEEWHSRFFSVVFEVGEKARAAVP